MTEIAPFNTNLPSRANANSTEQKNLDVQKREDKLVASETPLKKFLSLVFEDENNQSHQPLSLQEELQLSLGDERTSGHMTESLNGRYFHVCVMNEYIRTIFYCDFICCILYKIVNNNALNTYRTG